MLAASIESFFVFLVIAAISALANWLKNRGEKETDWSDLETPPPTRRTPPSGRSTPPSMPRPTTGTSPSSNWEEELRRMLEGTVPTAPRPAPPPIVVQERKTPPSLPRQSTPSRPEAPVMSLPKSFDQKFYKAHCNNCDGHIEFPASAMDEVVPCPFCHKPTVLRPFEDTAVEALAHQHVLADFNATEKSYD
jgi:hypothetical protein